MVSNSQPLRDGYRYFSEAFTDTLNRSTRVTEQQFIKSVSVETFIENRNRYGGPAPAALDSALDGYGEHMSALEKNSRLSKERQSTARNTLDSAFNKIVES